MPPETHRAKTRPAFAVIRRPSLHYPNSLPGFSPNIAYPEYRFGSLSNEPNLVYAAVRDLLAQAGLDEQHYNTPEWNPLGELVRPGSNVFVLCNFVYHARVLENNHTFSAKVTHASVLRAVLDYLLIAVGPTGKVRFGNAPVQGADWSELMQETGADRVVAFYERHGICVEACDLRAFVAQRDIFGNVTHIERRDTPAISVSFDLGEKSMLAPLGDQQMLFRVSEYDWRRTQAFHQDGHHVYVLNRAALEADVIFSIPKLKTHQKCAVTCGLKGTVGTIAEKDCLAHHRLGPPEQGGDEYPTDKTRLMRLQSHFHDYVWQTPATSFFGRMLRIVDRNLQRIQRLFGLTQAGSWHGNDTTWRMALDIARVLRYGSLDGKLHDVPQRPHYMIVDGIVGGEGNGPLAMTPVDSGVLVFAPDVPVGDAIAAALMGFDPHLIPIVREAFNQQSYPLTDMEMDSVKVACNDGLRTLEELSRTIDRSFQPPPGWVGYLEKVR